MWLLTMEINLQREPLSNVLPALNSDLWRTQKIMDKEHIEEWWNGVNECENIERISSHL